MAKKKKKTVAKQVKLEKQISKLKAEEKKLAKKAQAVEKKCLREQIAKDKVLARLDKMMTKSPPRAWEKAQVAYDKLDEKDLPSQKLRNKLDNQEYRLSDKIRSLENDLAALRQAAVELAKNVAKIPDAEEGEE